MLDANMQCMMQICNEQHDSGYRSALTVLSALWKILKPASVLDVGYSNIHWLLAARDLGAENLVGVGDSSSGIEGMNDDHFMSLECELENGDWIMQLPAKKRFDLVISLNVVNILSIERGPSFITALCDGTDLVLFSGAVPGLAVVETTNPQSPSYWSAIFNRHDFACFDFLRSGLWNSSDVEWEYLQNVLLFARRESDAFHALAKFGKQVSSPIIMVHPQVHAQAIYDAEQQVSELKKIAFENPFGRDDRIRILEDKIETLRSTQGQLDTAYKELSARHKAVVSSWSWKLTAPVRSIGALLGWGAATD